MVDAGGKKDTNQTEKLVNPPNIIHIGNWSK